MGGIQILKCLFNFSKGSYTHTRGKALQLRACCMRWIIVWGCFGWQRSSLPSSLTPGVYMGKECLKSSHKTQQMHSPLYCQRLYVSSTDETDRSSVLCRGVTTTNRWEEDADSHCPLSYKLLLQQINRTEHKPKRGKSEEGVKSTLSSFH